MPVIIYVNMDMGSVLRCGFLARGILISTDFDGTAE
jgi:hypothetical protein